jgi:hypothetical protein
MKNDYIEVYLLEEAICYHTNAKYTPPCVRYNLDILGRNVRPETGIVLYVLFYKREGVFY